MLYILLALIPLAVLILLLYMQNNIIVHTRYEFTTKKLTEDLRIVHISDLHGKIFSSNRLHDHIMREKPDMIAFTGDVADRYKSDAAAMRAVEELASLGDIAPVYAVSGNHEYGRENREELFCYMEECGISILRNDTDRFVYGGGEVSMLGLDEVGYHCFTEKLLERFSRDKRFKLLLSHFPERFAADYCEYDIDLTLSGHAHGGQIVLPFIGGLYSPGQGLFPKYARGMHVIKKGRLIVSRGLGNSRFPLRFANYPEVITIDIKTQK